MHVQSVVFLQIEFKILPISLGKNNNKQLRKTRKQQLFIIFENTIQINDGSSKAVDFEIIFIRYRDILLQVHHLTDQLFCGV